MLHMPPIVTVYAATLCTGGVVSREATKCTTGMFVVI